MIIPRHPVAEERWFQVGSSLVEDARTAGEQAAGQALGERSPALVLVFCSAQLDARAVLDGVCAVTPDVAVVGGATTMGEIAPAGPYGEGVGVAPGVVVVALGGSGFQVSASVSRRASEHRRESGAEAAAAMASITLPHRVLLMIADGLTREQHHVVRGAYGEVGASVPILGGCSADNMVAVLAATLEREGLPGASVTIEMTESVLMSDPERTRQALAALKALGLRLAIDDFGTGYSSLSYLRQFPVDQVKIDRTFVSGLRPGVTDDIALIRGILDLCRTLRLQTVAEGIEDAEQLAILTELGCDLGQGYYLGRPMPASAAPPRMQIVTPIA